MNAKFWLSIFGVLLMVFAFFAEKAGQVPFVEHLIASRCMSARKALDILMQNGTLTDKNKEFRYLVEVFSENLSDQILHNVQILSFTDSKAFVPGPKGPMMLVEVNWSNSQQSYTSREEIAEFISKSFQRTIWPIQFIIFMIGVFIELFSICIIYFPRRHVPRQKAGTTTI